MLNQWFPLATLFIHFDVENRGFDVLLSFVERFLVGQLGQVGLVLQELRAEQVAVVLAGLDGRYYTLVGGQYGFVLSLVLRG